MRDALLAKFPELTANDVRSTSMGASGLDIQLSEKAANIIGFGIECKNQEKLGPLYDWFEQASTNAETADLFTALIVKRNHKNPLVVIDLDTWLLLLRNLNDFYNSLEKNDKPN